jgi:tetratricopeptide (TPR) repeat protein
LHSTADRLKVQREGGRAMSSLVNSPTTNPPDPPAESRSGTQKVRGGQQLARGRASSLVRKGLAVLVALGLLACTVWRGTRFDALNEAIAAERAHDDQTALRRALDHLNRWPADGRAARIAARALTRLHFPDRAEPYYQVARRLGPLGLDDLHARALSLAEAHQLDRAVAAYDELLRDHPNDPRALQRLAAIRYAQLRWKDALALAERLTQVPGQEVPAWGLVGSIEHEQKHPDRAAAAYERVLVLDPELRLLPLPRQLFWTNLARDLIDSGQPAQARRYLSKALAERPDPTQTDLLGLAYQYEGALDEAERAFRGAIALDAELFPAWLHLGRLLLQPQGDRVSEAVEILQKAAALAPDSFEPPYSLSLAYRRLGRDAESEEYRKRSESLRKQIKPRAAGSKP